MPLANLKQGRKGKWIQWTPEVEKAVKIDAAQRDMDVSDAVESVLRQHYGLPQLPNAKVEK